MRALVWIIFFLVASPAFGQQPKAITNSIGMKLVLIPAGTFTMGTPMGEQGRRDGETPHEVTISKSYYLSAYEVTQEQYEEVIGKNPSKFKGEKNPIETVSWDDAVSFSRTVTELPEEKAAGREYRLPTEAEWEYACRASSGAAYCFGDSPESLDEYAWHGEVSQSKSHPVGEKKANRWGLFDMHGNVWEWCEDGFGAYPSGAATDPVEATRSGNLVVAEHFVIGGDLLSLDTLEGKTDPLLARSLFGEIFPSFGLVIPLTKAFGSGSTFDVWTAIIGSKRKARSIRLASIANLNASPSPSKDVQP